MPPDPLLPFRQSSVDEPRVETCDGCGNWTDRPVTKQELARDWGWLFEMVDNDPSQFCPECI